LVLFEIFEKALPFFDQMRQMVVLPPSFKSAVIVMPCLHPVPQYRPTSDQVVDALDNTIRKTLETVCNTLSPKEKAALETSAIVSLLAVVREKFDYMKIARSPRDT
jgi:hypothetical protein